MVRGHRAATIASVRTRALLLRRVDYGESDLVVTLFTEELGRVSALARGARRSQKRFAGSLEPLHMLRIALDESSGGDLYLLREAIIEVARHRLTSDLERMDAAGRALGWVRRGAPQRTCEPDLWRVISEFLERLDDREDAHPVRLHLAELGLKLLVALGWGLDFERCVRCGKACRAGQPAFVDPARGGLVCRGCGGARLRLGGPMRERLLTLTHKDPASLCEDDVKQALELVEDALFAHVGSAETEKRRHTFVHGRVRTKAVK